MIYTRTFTSLHLDLGKGEQRSHYDLQLLITLEERRELPQHGIPIGISTETCYLSPSKTLSMSFVCDSSGLREDLYSAAKTLFSLRLGEFLFSGCVIQQYPDIIREGADDKEDPWVIHFTHYMKEEVCLNLAKYFSPYSEDARS